MTMEELKSIRAEIVRQALQENRVISFRWNNDCSGCVFKYRGIDNHGLPSTFVSSLNAAHAMSVFRGINIMLEGGAR